MLAGPHKSAVATLAKAWTHPPAPPPRGSHACQSVDPPTYTTTPP